MVIIVSAEFGDKQSHENGQTFILFMFTAKSRVLPQSVMVEHLSSIIRRLHLKCVRNMEILVYIQGTSCAESRRVSSSLLL